MQKVINNLLIVLLSVFFIVQCSEKKEILATVGSFEITKTELINELKKSYPKQQNFHDIDIQKKKDVLNRLILNKLKLNAAYELNLDSDTEIITAVENQRKSLLANKYYETFIVDKFVPEEAIEEYMLRQGIELKATHVLIGHKNSNRAKDRTKEEAKKLAETIAKEAKSGSDFEALVEKYSDDPSSKANKGNLGYFTWGKMVKPFQEAAWDLKIGEISDPVETVYGFHVIRLDDKKEVPNYQPQRSKENIIMIKKTLYQAHADSGMKLWKKTYENLKTDYQYEADNNAQKRFSDILRNLINKEQININSFDDSVKTIVLAKWDGGEISANTLIERYKNRLSRAMGSFMNVENLKKEVENLATVEIVALDAVKNNLDENEEIIQNLSQFRESRLTSLAEKMEVTEKVNLSDEEIFEFYKNNSSKFKKAAMIEIWEIAVKDEKSANQILNKAKRGINFETLAKQYSTDKRLGPKGGYLGFRPITSRGSVSKKAFDLGPGGKIGGPVKYGSNWVILKTGKIQDEFIRPYEEVKNRAENQLRGNRLREQRTLWEESIKLKYSVVIDENKLNEV